VVQGGPVDFDEILFGQARGTDDHVDALVDGRHDVGLDHIGPRKIHQHVGGGSQRLGDRSTDGHIQAGVADDVFKVVALVRARDGAHQPQIVCLRHRHTQRLADPAGRTGNTHIQLHRITPYRSASLQTCKSVRSVALAL
jgi:hypothetical protein